MHRALGRTQMAALVAASSLAASCLEPSDAERAGTLAVSVTTNGGDIDLDGYLIRVNSGSERTVPPVGVVYFNGLDAGSHTVHLTGVADNCDVVFSDSRQIQIASADTTHEQYIVQCDATGVVVTLTVTGLDPGVPYTASVDGVRASIAPDAVQLFTRLAPGTRTVELSEVASNCAVSGSNPRMVALVARQLARVEFQVTCVATTGVLLVTSVTTGQDLDVNGYLAQVGALPPQPMPALGTIAFDGLTPGRHELRIGGMAPNCVLDGNSAVAFDVTAGRVTRDTVRVGYTLQCTRSWDLAFARASDVLLATSDGLTVSPVATGYGAAWSPDGQHLAFDCSGVCLAHLNGVGPTHVPFVAPHIQSPAWRPDGTISVVGLECVGFYCYYGSITGVFVLSLGGDQIMRLAVPAHVVSMYHLDWSPDGNWLAFTCYIEYGVEDLCRISVAGTFQRLTSNQGSNRNPAWAPDGSGLVFETTRFGTVPELAFLAANGTVTRLSPGTAATEPDWLPDGSRIVFAGPGANTRGLFLMNRDGTGIARLTSSLDRAPAWRP